MAVTANIHEAKATLSKLIQRALDGEQVIIAKAGKPLVMLTPVPQPKLADRSALFGMFRGQMILSDDWEESPFDAEMERKWYGAEEAPLRHVAEADKPFDPE